MLLAEAVDRSHHANPREHRWPVVFGNQYWCFINVCILGLDEDLDDAAKQAVREMIKHVCARTNLTRNEAYILCSLAGNLRVTQLVDGNKGIHMLLPKSLLQSATQRNHP